MLKKRSKSGDFCEKEPNSRPFPGISLRTPQNEPEGSQNVICIVSPTFERAEQWCRANEMGVDDQNVVVFPTNSLFSRFKGRHIGEGDKIVWISEWQQEEHAEHVQSVVLSCIDAQRFGHPEYVYA